MPVRDDTVGSADAGERFDEPVHDGPVGQPSTDTQRQRRGSATVLVGMRVRDAQFNGHAPIAHHLGTVGAIASSA
jgi:hypothetical protein